MIACPRTSLAQLSGDLAPLGRGRGGWLRELRAGRQLEGLRGREGSSWEWKFLRMLCYPVLVLRWRGEARRDETILG